VVDSVALRIRIDLDRLASQLVMLLEPAVRLFRELVDGIDLGLGFGRRDRNPDLHHPPVGAGRPPKSAFLPVPPALAGVTPSPKDSQRPARPTNP
jgi:hypothetical protein